MNADFCVRLVLRRALGVFLVLFISSLPADAQTPPTRPSSPASPSSETGTTIKLRVNLVQVRVVVRDSKGNPVRDLQREDFQLYDQGKLQLISTFVMETPETRLERSEAAAKTQLRPAELASVPLSVLPDRFVMLVFDDAHLDVGDLIYARKAALKFVDSLAPSDRVAVYSTSGKFIHDFTGNSQEIRTALLGISGIPASATAAIVALPPLVPNSPTNLPGAGSVHRQEPSPAQRRETRRDCNKGIRATRLARMLLSRPLPLPRHRRRRIFPMLTSWMPSTACPVCRASASWC